MSKPKPGPLPTSAPTAMGAVLSPSLGALRQTIPLTKHHALFRVRINGYAYEFDDGFVWQPDDAEPQICRWDDVATAHWYASQHYVNGVY